MKAAWCLLEFLTVRLIMPENLQEQEVTAPPEPETLEQTGLAETLVEHLVIKILYFRGELLLVTPPHG